MWRGYVVHMLCSPYTTNATPILQTTQTIKGFMRTASQSFRKNVQTISGSVEKRWRNMLLKSVTDETLITEKFLQKTPQYYSDDPVILDIMRHRAVNKHNHCTNMFVKYSNSEFVKFTTGVLNLDDNKLNCVWQIVQPEILKRMHTLDLNELLLLADMNYILSSQRKHKSYFFIYNLFDVLAFRKNEFQFSRSHLLQVLFYVGITRQVKTLLKNVIEELLSDMEDFDKYSLEEVSLICFSFFVSNSRILHIDLLEKISNKLLSELNKHGSRCQDFHVICILKCIRHARFDLKSVHDELAKVIVKSDWLCNKKLVAVSHIAKTFAASKIGSDELFSKISQWCERCFKTDREYYHLRGKDPTLLLIALYNMYASIPENLIYATITAWEDDKFKKKFLPLFLESITPLLEMDVCPEDFINFTFKQCNINLFRDVDAFKGVAWRFLFIDDLVAAKGINYNGKRLSQEQKELCRSHSRTRLLERDLYNRLGLMPLMHCLQILLKNPKKVQVVQATYLLSVDIELVLDENGVPLVLDGIPYDFCHIENEEDVKSILQELTTDFKMICPNEKKEMEIFEPEVNKNLPNRRIFIKVCADMQYIGYKSKLSRMNVSQINILNNHGSTVLVIPPAVSKQLHRSTQQEIRDFTINNIIKPLRINIEDYH